MGVEIGSGRKERPVIVQWEGFPELQSPEEERRHAVPCRLNPIPSLPLSSQLQNASFHYHLIHPQQL